MVAGRIFDIKRFALNDGQGIRLTVFFKGCSLNCAWCHNPEGKSVKMQKMYTASRCIACGSCVEACPEDACILTSDGIVTDPSKCKLCAECAEACPTKATEMSGTEQTVDYIMDVIEKETIFFDHSGGGVTFSGGEPLMHPEFLIDLLDSCGERGIHRTVDTCGFAKPDVLLNVAQRTDHFLYDLKMMDNDKHKKWTGVSNAIILDNLQKLSKTGASINIRIPLIVGVNSDDDNIKRTAEFVKSLDGEKKLVNLLPYHDIAANKYLKLGKEYDSADFAEPGAESKKHIISIFESYGLQAVFGG